MLKVILSAIMCLGALTFLYGCGATGIRVEGYTENKPRADQAMDEGNAGYLVGTPKEVDRSNIKKTRKMYVIEFSKEAGDIPAKEVDYQGSYVAPSYTPPAPAVRQPMVPQAQPALPPKLVSYTVEKDDTLQKISKKFYDSYSKWPRIFDANRSVLKDPNRLKPGTVIQVPVDQ